MNCVSQSIAAESSSPPRRWSARLNLIFAQARERTELRHCEHQGPLRVQRLFHPPGEAGAHCYLLHPPGGVVLGDELEIDVALRSGRALLTTPSAGRFYGVGNYREAQRQTLRLTVAGGRLEWLPQETIVFPGANALLDTHIELAPDASLAFWDVLVLGRPASGLTFDRGCLRQRLQVQQNGQPLLVERMDCEAQARFMEARGGLNGCSTVGVALFTAAPPQELLTSWHQTWEERDRDGAYALSQRGELLIARYLGEHALRCREAFSDLWQRVATLENGARPCVPRIWHT